jgi:hypothetical protein
MYGRGTALGPGTFAIPGIFPQFFGDGGERDVPHYFTSESELRWLFNGFQIASLRHEEVSVARPASDGQPLTWFKVPHAFFWRVAALVGADAHNDSPHTEERF